MNFPSNGTPTILDDPAIFKQFLEARCAEKFGCNCDECGPGWQRMWTVFEDQIKIIGLQLLLKATDSPTFITFNNVGFSQLDKKTIYHLFTDMMEKADPALAVSAVPLNVIPLANVGRVTPVDEYMTFKESAEIPTALSYIVSTGIPIEQVTGNRLARYALSYLLTSPDYDAVEDVEKPVHKCIPSCLAGHRLVTEQFYRLISPKFNKCNLSLDLMAVTIIGHLYSLRKPDAIGQLLLATAKSTFTEKLRAAFESDDIKRLRSALSYRLGQGWTAPAHFFIGSAGDAVAIELVQPTDYTKTICSSLFSFIRKHRLPIDQISNNPKTVAGLLRVLTYRSDKPQPIIKLEPANIQKFRLINHIHRFFMQTGDKPQIAIVATAIVGFYQLNDFYNGAVVRIQQLPGLTIEQLQEIVMMIKVADPAFKI